MFRKAADLPTYKRYLKVLRAALKRLKQVQQARNGQDDPDGRGPQTHDVILSCRYFGGYTFDDQNDKTPRALLLVGQKTLVDKVAAELIHQSKGESAKDGATAKPLPAGAKGYVYWDETEETFHFQCKGPVKLPGLKKLLKNAGFRDQATLGLGTGQGKAKAGPGGR
jgi:hypothetical protein